MNATSVFCYIGDDDTYLNIDFFLSFFFASTATSAGVL